MLLVACLLTSSIGLALDAPQGRKQRDYPVPASAWSAADIILGNPTDRSVEYVLHPKESGRVKVALGNNAGSWVSVAPGKPYHGKLSGLEPDREYTYRIIFQPAVGTETTSPPYRFHTQRKVGSSFSFMVQGDSHPERVGKMHDPAIYESSMLMAEAARPDLFICLGDDFSVDTLQEFTRPNVESVYRRQVPYLGLVGRTVPVFLVNGNHEQAAKVNLNGTPESLAVWAQTTRNDYFAQPAPDGFYTGDAEQVSPIGLLRDYYAWTWGDAQFVVIDPYWHSDIAVDNSAGKGPKNGGGKKGRDLWQVTLGKAQYQWLRDTLAHSKARYKFVFAHHVSGTGRGGVEMAPYFEWGGGAPGEFAARRPGWEAPIHQLFVKYGVTVFFQGHDHIFCRQQLDGVTYQSCPCPSSPSDSTFNETAYSSGDKVPGNGLVKVQVDSGQLKLSLVRPNVGGKDPTTVFSYSIPARKGQG